MTRPQITALLWCLAGVAFLVAGWISEPRQTLLMTVGAAYFIIAAITLRRARRGSPPGNGRA